ncbi:MAG: metallophosphoesterase [Nitrososphaerota archaeon]|nr:metallophosphoesterase [Nitrososphaerota archaeon]
MNGYRIAFITDVHSMPIKRLAEITDNLNKKSVDLLVLGGDYPSSKENLRKSMETMSRIISTDGIFGVEGNHDNYTDVLTVMNEYGINMLSNSGLYIQDNFYLAGVEELRNHNASIAVVTQGALPEDFVLLIAHNPDISMQQETGGVDLFLCGHTHGGQITFFGIFGPALIPNFVTDYNQRFMSGWSESRDGTPVYVSNGVGTSFYMPRVFARPQVILITLLNE